MSSLHRLHLPARISQRSGFTLVELLVVIGIIAILAGVALGPITQGLEKAKESAFMQTSRTIALSAFQYQVDNGTYPGGAKSQDVAAAMVQGGYITDPSIFAASKDKAFNGPTSTITTMAAANICWDFFVTTQVNATTSTNYGMSTSDPDGMPLVFETGQDIVPPAQGPSADPVTLNASGTNPSGNNGMAVCYKSNSAAFLKGINTGSGYVLNSTPATQIFNGSFTCTPGNYKQLKPQ